MRKSTARRKKNGKKKSHFGIPKFTRFGIPKYAGFFAPSRQGNMHHAANFGIPKCYIDFGGSSSRSPSFASDAGNVRKQKGRSTLAGSALILSDGRGFDDVDTPGIRFSGRAGICALCLAVSRADLHDNFAIR